MKLPSTLEGLLAASTGIPPYTRSCLERAHQVAHKLHAEELHPEHLLVALLADEDSAAGQAIVHAFADPETILSEVMALCPGILVIGSKRSLPFSVLGVRALEASRDVARGAGAASIAPLHLLLAGVASLDRELQRDLTALGLDPALAAPAPSEACVPEDGPLLKFFNNGARRAMAAACRQANRLGRDAIAPAHLMLGALEVTEGKLAGLSATRVQLFFNGRDEDSTPLDSRPLPCHLGVDCKTWQP